MRAHVIGALFLSLSLASCRGRTASPGDLADRPLAYDAGSSWACRPGRADACAGDLTTTELRPDGSRVAVSPEIPAAPKVDCFYVYPTVDLDLAPGNHTDFSDPRIGEVVVAQAAQLRRACAVWVPFYRQVTLGTYLRPRELEAGLAVAYADVERAFSEWLRRADPARKIVLVGHSQGAEMVVRLLRRFFDRDPAMRARLLVAMPIGGQVEVLSGSATGGTFESLPLCRRDDEVGCVVAYRSHAEGDPIHPGRWSPSPGHETACVNPTDVADNARRPFASTIVPLTRTTRRRLRGVDDVTTPFVSIPAYYTGRCEPGPGGYRYLAVTTSAPPGDARPAVLPLERAPRSGPLAGLGLHVLDVTFALGDLVAMVERRAASLP